MSDTKRDPIEVWLRTTDRRVLCVIVNPDEGAYPHEITSRSLRGAEREITAWLIAADHWPAGVWQVEAKDDAGEPLEAWRRFTPPG